MRMHSANAPTNAAMLQTGPETQRPNGSFVPWPRPSIAKPATSMMKKPLGRAIRRPDSRRFDTNDTHAEQDQPVVVGNGQIEVSLIPEMFANISQELTCVFDRGALGVADGWEIYPLIILNGEFGWMVRVEIEPSHGGATCNTARCCGT